MNVSAYLQQSRQRAAEHSKVIKDNEVFDFNYIPDEPVMRKEVEQLVDALVRYEQTNIPCNMAVIGSRGCGKTLIVRHLAHLLKKDSKLSFHYANCRYYNTSFKIIAHLLGIRGRGLGLQELYEQFKSGTGHRTVVILDEIDLMSAKDKNREILYLLSRGKPPVMMLLLSNNPKVVDELDLSIRSALQPEVIPFRNYDAGQLHEILLQRARIGLHRYDKALPPEIAGLTVQNSNGDARLAIKTLFYSVTDPQRSTRDNFDRARRDIVIDLIADLNNKNLLILRAAQLSQRAHVKEVYQRYLLLSADKHEPAFSYVYFYHNLSYLQSIGLMLLISTKVGRTFTNSIALTFNERILDAVFEQRF